MQYPERFSGLPEYAFPRLRALLEGVTPQGPEIAMSIGEPQHQIPDFVAEIISENIGRFRGYPNNNGEETLLSAISAWLHRRYGVSVDPSSQIMALNGTREGLFNAALALCPDMKNGKKTLVLIPNPFYQCYAVAAVAAGAKPLFVAAEASHSFLPDYSALSPEILEQTALVYICSPSNPQGAVADKAYWEELFRLAERYDFRIFADECYSEIYRDTPPIGALEVAQQMGFDPERVFIFHSLSKRSNLAGLRSGFVAGGAKGIAEIRKLRAYAGAPLPTPLQFVAAKAWADEAHVSANRALYQRKYQIADEIFGGMSGYQSPEAGFFLWLNVGDGEKMAKTLYAKAGVKVLPGKYLSRPDETGMDPGAAYIRVALVAPEEEISIGLQKIRTIIEQVS